MKVVAYHTPGPYAEEAALLRESLKAAGMDYRIEKIPDGGGWRINTWQKPFFLSQMRREEDGALLYLDADAFVHRDCTAHFEGLEERGYDFGAHWFRGPSKGHNRSEVRANGWWMLSGTLFLGDTEGCRRLIDAWCGLNETWREHGIVDGGGQKNLWFTVTCMEDLKVARLHGRYCYVFDKPWAYADREPVIIEHTIASRIHRGKSAVGVAKRRQRLAELRAALP